MAANVMQSEDNDFRRRGEGGDNQQRQMNSQDIEKNKKRLCFHADVPSNEE